MDDRIDKQRRQIEQANIRNRQVVTSMGGVMLFVVGSAAGTVIGEYAKRAWFDDR